MISPDDGETKVPARDERDGLMFRPVPGSGICERLSDKWSVLVLWRLEQAGHRRLRFSVLKRELGGITQRMLTLTLRHLERDGLVARDYHPEVPPRVEYSITELGLGALASLQSLNAWVRQHLPEVERNRRAYDDGGQ